MSTDAEKKHEIQLLQAQAAKLNKEIAANNEAISKILSEFEQLIDMFPDKEQ